MKRIPLTQGQYALVDDWNYDYLNQWKWYAYKRKNTYYAQRNIRINGKRTTLSLHRIIMKTPKGMTTDHKDFNGLNYQEYNMRNCTSAQNTMHRKKHSVRCSSKFKGVTWSKR